MRNYWLDKKPKNLIGFKQSSQGGQFCISASGKSIPFETAQIVHVMPENSDNKIYTISSGHYNIRYRTGDDTQILYFDI